MFSSRNTQNIQHFFHFTAVNKINHNTISDQSEEKCHIILQLELELLWKHSFRSLANCVTPESPGLQAA